MSQSNVSQSGCRRPAALVGARRDRDDRARHRARHDDPQRRAAGHRGEPARDRAPSSSGSPTATCWRSVRCCCPRGCSVTGTGGSARRWSAWSCSSLGSLWCALASSAGSLIAARTLLGVGAAVLIPLAMSSVVVLFDAEERTRAIAVARHLDDGRPAAGADRGRRAAPALLVGFGVRRQPAGHRARPGRGAPLPARDGRSPRPPAGPGRHTPHLRRDARRDVRRHRGPGARVDRPAGGGRAGRWRGVVRGRSCGGSAATAASSRSSTRCCGDSRRSGGAPSTAAVASLAFFGAMFVVPQYLRGVLGEDALGTGLRMVPMVVGLFVGLRLTMMLLPRFGARVLGVVRLRGGGARVPARHAGRGGQRVRR